MDPITRRRFLWMLGGAAGLGGWAIWQRFGEASLVDVATPTTVMPATLKPTSTAASTTAPPPPTTTTTSPPAVALEVIGRNGWGAREPIVEYGSHTIEQLTIHHTAVELANDSQAPSRLRGHQAYHQQQGWADIAYHFAIDRLGNVYEARPYSAPGDTFTNYDPAGHFLPVLEGDYNTQQPTEPQVESLVLLLAWAASEFGVDPATIGGHRDHASTTCPGDNLYRFIIEGSLEQRVRDRLEAGGVDLSVVRGDAATVRVAEIEA